MRRFLALLLSLFISMTTFSQSADTRNYIDFIYSNNQAETDIVDGLKVGGSTVTIDNILDEDDMVSDSPTSLATQQSIKAYVDAETINPPVSSTDECIARWDGVTALVLQDSVVCITDAGIMSGVESIIFNAIASPAYQEGLLFYDSADDSLSYYTEEPDVTVNIGRESLIKVRNVSGVTIANGKAVYMSGANGNRPTIDLARSDSRTTLNLVALTTHSIENNTNGYVTILGQVNDLDTSAFTAGDTVYVDPTTAGELTNVKPSRPNFVYDIGVVEASNPTNGSIQVQTSDLTGDGGTDTYVRFSNGDGFFTEDADFTYDIATDILSLAGLTTSSNITMTGTGALKLPEGTTAQRPTPVVGMTRFNSTLGDFEGYDGFSWDTLGGGAGAARCIVYDSKASGTDGGTFTSGSWITRDLNTSAGSCAFLSLAANQMTLAAGTYKIYASAPAREVDQHRIKVYNVTDAVDITPLGSSELVGSTSVAQTVSTANVYFSIAASKAIEIRHQCTSTTLTFGLGRANNFGAETYTQVVIERL